MSKDLKEFRKEVIWISGVRPFQVEGTADAKPHSLKEIISKKH